MKIEMPSKRNLLLASLLFIQPAQANDENTAMMNLGRSIGWVQASCSYGEMGWLTPRQTETGIGVILKGIQKDHDTGMVKLVRRMTMEQYPQCGKYWPDEF
jgi:hypothetical protein